LPQLQRLAPISCTTQGQECKAWAQSQGAQASSYSSACAREVSACISRCKGGSNLFIGVFKGAGGGQQYPVSECKQYPVRPIADIKIMPRQNNAPA